MRYDVVIFDLDGTLIDSGRGIVRAAEESITLLGYPEMAPDEIRSMIGPPIGRSIIERNGFGPKELKEFNSVFRDIYKNRYLMDVEIYPGITDLLRDLGGSSFVGIATNKRIDYAIELLDRLNISGSCDEIQCLDLEEKLTKRDLIENCIKASGAVDRHRVVVIGDTVSDESAAKECGTDFIGVTFGFGFKSGSDVKYGHSVDDVPSLRRILLG